MGEKYGMIIIHIIAFNEGLYLDHGYSYAVERSAVELKVGTNLKLYENQNKIKTRYTYLNFRYVIFVCRL